MDASQEFLQHVNDPNIPDKNRILRTRKLVDELTDSIADRSIGERLRRSLNDAYLNLHLATIADNSAMIQQCRRDCAALVTEIGKAIRPPRPQPVHP